VYATHVYGQSFAFGSTAPSFTSKPIFASIASKSGHPRPTIDESPSAARRVAQPIGATDRSPFFGFTYAMT